MDQGGTVSFKVDTPASAYRIDIYRMGYYGGMGARKVATVRPAGLLPQNQPNCNTTAATGLIDCGNWAVSALWTVPNDAVSGIYFGHLVREDGTTGESHIVFVVRDDDGRSDLLFQTSDTTWQAYNEYGGNSLYAGSPAGRAYKVSYNRPFSTRGSAPEDWVFNAEYPMVRWLERNGYNLSYTTGVDSDRLGAELLEHRTLLSVGHDEYWSGTQRANWEAARAAGVHMAFFSGNEVFWKTRWEDSHRTLVTYKETHANAKIDPLPGVWTGTWRDPRFSPPADGGRPENALTGQIFTVNAGATTAIQVPAADGKMRFWRNTTIATQAAGATATLPNGTLGYEWDEDLDNGHRPAGAFRLSSTTVTGAPVLQDYGSTYASGTARHNMTLYRAPSGARVFGAGTVQWAWGLDSNHDRGSAAADVRMQQATVNLLADMASQPDTLQAGLTAATPSADATAPTSTITAPANNSSVQPGSQVTISGTASEAGGGVVGGVEVSTDSGDDVASGERAGDAGPTRGRRAPSGTYTLRSRAVDDSGNLETPGAGVTVTAGTGNQACPCSIWGSGDDAGQGRRDDRQQPRSRSASKFRSSTAGRIAGIRFYKGATNTGTHVGHLWTRTGTLLATATFTNETATGWQEVRFASPVDITAEHDVRRLLPRAARQLREQPRLLHRQRRRQRPAARAARRRGRRQRRLRLRAERHVPDRRLAVGELLGRRRASRPARDTTAPTRHGRGPGPRRDQRGDVGERHRHLQRGVDPSTVNANTVLLRDAAGAAVPAAVTYDAGSQTATLNPTAPLAASTTYTATVKGGHGGVKDLARQRARGRRQLDVHHARRVAVRLPVQHLGQRRDARRARGDDRQQRGRGRHALPRRRRRVHHRPALLQGRDEHRHARRPPVDATRGSCWRRRRSPTRRRPAGSR